MATAADLYMKEAKNRLKYNISKLAEMVDVQQLKNTSFHTVLTQAAWEKVMCDYKNDGKINGMAAFIDQLSFQKNWVDRLVSAFCEELQIPRAADILIGCVSHENQPISTENCSTTTNNQEEQVSRQVGLPQSITIDMNTLYKDLPSKCSIGEILQILDAARGLTRNWEFLAEKLDVTPELLRASQSPTLALLDRWTSSTQHATFGKLLYSLLEMNRYDIITDIGKCDGFDWIEQELNMKGVHDVENVNSKDNQPLAIESTTLSMRHSAESLRHGIQETSSEIASPDTHSKDLTGISEPALFYPVQEQLPRNKVPSSPVKTSEHMQSHNEENGQKQHDDINCNISTSPNVSSDCNFTSDISNCPAANVIKESKIRNLPYAPGPQISEETSGIETMTGEVYEHASSLGHIDDNRQPDDFEILTQFDLSHLRKNLQLPTFEQPSYLNNTVKPIQKPEQRNDKVPCREALVATNDDTSSICLSPTSDTSSEVAWRIDCAFNNKTIAEVVLDEDAEHLSCNAARGSRENVSSKKSSCPQAKVEINRSNEDEKISENLKLNTVDSLSSGLSSEHGFSLQENVEPSLPVMSAASPKNALPENEKYHASGDNDNLSFVSNHITDVYDNMGRQVKIGLGLLAAFSMTAFIAIKIYKRH